MNKYCKIFLGLLFLFSHPYYAYCEVLNKCYTGSEFIDDMRNNATFSVLDTLKLITYHNDSTGNFYDHALQGLFLDYINTLKDSSKSANSEQLTIIKNLYKKGAGKQNFKVTLDGIKNILSSGRNNYSPCVIGFCLITQILPNRKRLTQNDVAFFINFYKHTDSKFLQSAIYTTILNGDIAIKHKDIILKYGNYLDIYSLLASLIEVSKGKEQEIWKIKMGELKTQCPQLADKIDFFLRYECNKR